jgi:hypothetical protein
MVSQVGADLVDIVCDQGWVGKDLAIDLLEDKVFLLTPDEPGTIDQAAAVRGYLAVGVVEAISREDRVQHGRLFVGCLFRDKLREENGLIRAQTVAPIF